MKSTALGIHEDIGGPVIGFGGLNEIVSCRHADHDVTSCLLQSGIHRVSDESLALSPPDIAQRCAELFGDKVRDLVLESFEIPVGERHVFRIGADAERFLSLCETARHAEQAQDQEDTYGTSPHCCGSAKTVRTPP